MKEMTIKAQDDIRVVAHNQREEQLIRIINSQLNDVREYTKHNTFNSKDKTRRICERIVTEVNGELTALYFLDCMEDSHTVWYTEIIERMERESND